MSPTSPRRPSVLQAVVSVACAMLCWALVVAGHPLRWDRSGIAIAVGYCGAITVLPRLQPRRFVRAFGWAALAVWLLLLITSRSDFSGQSALMIAHTVAVRLLGWAGIVLPATVAESYVLPLGNDRDWLGAWLLALALTVTLAITIGVPALPGRFSMRSTPVIVAMVLLVVTPLALAIQLIRVGNRYASAERSTYDPVV